MVKTDEASYLKPVMTPVAWVAGIWLAALDLHLPHRGVKAEHGRTHSKTDESLHSKTCFSTHIWSRRLQRRWLRTFLHDLTLNLYSKRKLKPVCNITYPCTLSLMLWIVLYDGLHWKRKLHGHKSICLKSKCDWFSPEIPRSAEEIHTSWLQRSKDKA